MTQNEVLKNLEDELRILERLIKSGKNVIDIPHANKGARDYASENAKILLKYYIKRKEVYEIVISAIKEARQYRENGTVKECREAREKQKPKKPETIEWDFDYYKCPVCGEYIWATDNINSHKYCLNCGQKIEMEESE